MTAAGRHSTAIALRKLAQAGYTNLEQVDNTSDWVLLATPGIRQNRLGEVRRLCRPTWQPPSSQAVRAANWFLAAVQFALRHWPVKALVAVIQGSGVVMLNAESVDKRLALDVFASAAEHARCYCRARELIEAIWQVGGVEPDDVHPVAESSTVGAEWIKDAQTVLDETFSPDPAFNIAVDAGTAQDSDHFAHPYHKRLEIVRHYWIARENRQIQNKDAWARTHYQVTGKTLLSYEREFQDYREAILTACDMQ